MVATLLLAGTLTAGTLAAGTLTAGTLADGTPPTGTPGPVTLAAGPATGAGLAGAPDRGWVRYEVPMVAGTDGPCCYHIEGSTVQARGCNLDGNRGTTIISNSVDAGSVAIDGGTVSIDAGSVSVDGGAVSVDRRSAGSGPARLAVYLHLEGGRVDRVRAYGASCPVQADPATVPLRLGADDSRELLTRLVRENGRTASEAVMALAHHADGDAALIAIVSGDYPRRAKKKALFWLGQSGSDEAFVFLDRVLSAD